MRRTLSPLVALVVAFPLPSPSARAQTLPIALGTGVDTTARANHEVFALWRDYLRDRADTARANAHWVRDERARWPVVDLTASWVAPPGAWPRGLRATVVDLGPEAPGDTSTFVVRTLFARDTVPVALVRVYAVRVAPDGGMPHGGMPNGDMPHGGMPNGGMPNGWALANALPRLTRDWTHARIDRVEFIYPASHRYDEALAARAARFVDSAAAATGVRLADHVEFYFAPTPREMARVLGVDFGVLANTGRVYPEDALLVAGAPNATEWNPHDLAHVVLGGAVGATGRWWSEGAATWLGGRSGKDFPRLVRELDADLARNPGRTLDSLVAPHAWRDSVSAAGAAMLVRLAFERGGLRAVQSLVTAPADTPEEVRRAAAQVLGGRPDEVERVWRAAIRAMRP